jgi:hypothetical protein
VGPFFGHAGHGHDLKESKMKVTMSRMVIRRI